MNLVRIDNTYVWEHPVETWVNPDHVVLVERFYPGSEIDGTRSKIIMDDGHNVFSGMTPDEVGLLLRRATL